MGASRYGTIVEIEIVEGYLCRDPVYPFPKLESGSRVKWNTYYARRERDGAIRPVDGSPVEIEPAAGGSATKRKTRKEATE